MRPVYAVQLEIRPADASDIDQLQTRVQVTVVNWIRRWYERRNYPPPDIPVEGGRIEPVEIHRVDVSSDTASSGERLWRLAWSYPSDQDDKLLWESTCVVARAGAQLAVSLVLRISSRQFTVAPAPFELRRPHLVKTLVESLPCYLGSRQLGASPHLVSVEDVDSLVDELLDGRRRLPIVLFSREIHTEGLIASPGRAADTLAGLAHVYLVNDRWAGFALSDALGSRLSCWDGAARVYWPGFTRDSVPTDHWLFLPDRVRELEFGGSGFAAYLLKRLAPMSVFRFVETEAARRAQAAIEADRVREAADLRERLRTGAAQTAELEQELLAIFDQNEKLVRERDRQRAELDDAQFHSMELEEENQQLKENVRLITAHMPATAAPEPAEAEGWRPRSVREALEMAGTEFAGQLVIWDSAMSSADRSHFARPEDVHRGLAAIAEVAVRYFRSREADESMGSWVDAFESMGLKYKPKESPTTLTMYGEDRFFTHEGQRRQMLRHLTLGGGDRTNCLQIYFDIDEEARRFVIGYCGVHLPYAGHRT